MLRAALYHSAARLPFLSSMRHSLLLHPACRSASVKSIAVEVTPSRGTLAVRYFVAGDMGGLKLPLPIGPLRTDELWQHTCFELFLRAPGQDSYYEFNFAPSLQWAAYSFDSYRQGMRPLEIAAPRIEMRQDADSFELQAVLAPAGSPGFDARSEWSLALSSVIEEASGQISYWALAHPPGKPDFHDAAAFTICLNMS
ncbi:MAG TPA: DOMON-like domain-containing protein [Rhizomicrobium sp.]|nr:DOMON-like domain-containing protein [Rhizomicrobium sp.]